LQKDASDPPRNLPEDTKERKGFDRSPKKRLIIPRRLQAGGDNKKIKRQNLPKVTCHSGVHNYNG